MPDRCTCKFPTGKPCENAASVVGLACLPCWEGLHDHHRAASATAPSASEGASR